MADQLAKQHVAIMIPNSTKTGKLLTNTKKCSKDKRTRGYLETRMETLLDYWACYTKSYDLLTVSMDSETLKTKYDCDMDDNFEQTEEHYLDLKTWPKDKFYDITPMSESSKSDTTSELPKLRPKLPPIAISQFSGNYNQWMSFRALFLSLIHCDDRLSKIEAEQLLKNYSLTVANYDDAWIKLNERYENKLVILNNILSRFLTPKKLTTESAKGVKDSLDTTSQCLTSLKKFED
ncbi:unnamed protein product [Parnassius mnemosyne]|uniref:Uncharacterized protein n=1 Tax=Parnassius mnemosyne TaxID=213953 RepID=A0AAV1MBJ4_9NEOP